MDGEPDLHGEHDAGVPDPPGPPSLPPSRLPRQRRQVRWGTGSETEKIARNKPGTYPQCHARQNFLPVSSLLLRRTKITPTWGLHGQMFNRPFSILPLSLPEEFVCLQPSMLAIVAVQSSYNIKRHFPKGDNVIPRQPQGRRGQHDCCVPDVVCFMDTHLPASTEFHFRLFGDHLPSKSKENYHGAQVTTYVATHPAFQRSFARGENLANINAKGQVHTGSLQTKFSLMHP